MRVRRTIWILLSAAVAFLLILVVRLPAAWAAALLPAAAAIECIEPAGTLWRGHCRRLVAHGAPLGPLDWSLRPVALLRGALAGTASLRPVQGPVAADFELALDGGALELRAVNVDVQLDPPLLPQLPASLRGRVRAQLGLVRLADRRLEALTGRIETHRLQQVGQTATDIGDYELVFPEVAAGAPVRGTLRDLGGPLSVAGTVTLTTEPGYLIEGTVATRPQTPPALARQIEFLGTPDAAGRRPFSLSGFF